MIVKQKQPLGVISWLSTTRGGYVSTLYEPETIRELQELCTGFFTHGHTYDLIGHTSNTLYTPDYVCERMVSTRKLNHFEINDDCIICECGTSVRALSLAAIEAGIKGFEGLIDLPGTVGASLYGNAGCYGCSISGLLKEATILSDDGIIERVNGEWFAFAERSSSLKRGEKKAIILTATLHCEKANKDEIKTIAEHNHYIRKMTQPEAKNSLGSIFSQSGKPTLLNRSISAITKVYALALQLIGYNKEIIDNKRRHLTFMLLGATDVEPYVRHWNWYQWKDEKSHDLFWKYVKLHRRMFTRNLFEIEIKHNPSFIIP